MIRLGLIGYPLEHSLSPALHTAALNASGLWGQYLLYPVPPEDAKGLRDLVHLLRRGELTGLNVTIPHKQAIIPFLDTLSTRAKAIGAVNTLYVRDGWVIGDNTDAAGFRVDLRAFMPAPASALILGAGGAARAVIYALKERDGCVHVAARKVEQAIALGRGFPGTRPVEWSPEALGALDVDLIVNATPLGMFPQVDSCPWPEGLPLPHGAAIYDLVYNPAETRLLRLAHAAGLRARNGLGMLAEQAALAFELWTGRKVQAGLLLDQTAQTAR